ncbi:hypothetical protein C1E24_20150 [Pseudoalteromonas phenolica]|uniref:Glycosyl transferase family 1 domain-containing protein n=1 Tax=Pseudoalteromonas phenolica TaxID=161398 RepID=A0A5R9PYY9_9GAMM|nr:hypothetical protein [Pseudoalteromonas phenolica]TLX45199.1 hypothetical protein C1E24_20150 [Pseudoalteromonas phenolica]
MKLVLVNGLFLIQKVLLNLSILFFGFFSPKNKSGVIVGTEEIASILYSLTAALPSAKSVNLKFNPYYDEDYDYYFGKYKWLRPFMRFFSPVLLGYLLVNNKTFIYISAEGFLNRRVDGGEYEFKKLKKYGCNVICYFTGSDIRSFKLLDKFGSENSMDVITTYQPISHKGIDSELNENVRRMLGKVADKYASAVFNPSTDQMAYIERKCHPFLYFADETKIQYLPEKYKQDKKVVLHAPSSPIIKGTPIVRAAIKQLQEEGYDFEYVELIGVPNTQVMAELAKAHIVLNEFYALVPGVFGVEAMMNNAVLLTSADSELEPTLFEGANDAWVVTPYWQIYNNLKQALDSSMDELKDQADNGTKWVEKYCTYEFSAKYLNQVIDDLDD